MTLQDDFLFRKGQFDWEIWNRKDLLPHGWAALFTFIVGWVGAILGMYQTWYTGPLGGLIGAGADIGLPVAFAWAAVVYPPARWLEIRFVRR